MPARFDDLARELAPHVLGAVVRRYRDFAACEDAVQEALIAAASQWPRDGLPENPRGWLIHVASRRMLDYLRSEVARREREQHSARDPDAALTPFDDPDHAAPHDDTLVLLFMCCHPSLSPASAIALTLRAVGGLTTGEIARAFLVPESTMGQRISRAKQTIASSQVPFSLPAPHERASRVESVLHVLYLIFTEGYTASSGAALQRADLASEAIRLARALRAMLPDHAETAGLLALMLLTDARRHARTGRTGELIPLHEQDRSCWDRALIDEGVALISETLQRGEAGAYQIQAAIAAVHDEAETAAATDWAQIVALYAVMLSITDNPMVALNHAIAVAMTDGVDAGLARLAPLDADPRIAGHYRLDAVRGHLHEMASRTGLAVAHYERAAARTTSVPERHYLLTIAAGLRG